MPNQSKLLEWRAREAAAKAAEQAIKIYKAETAHIEGDLMEAFADEGVHSIKIDSPSGADMHQAWQYLHAQMLASMSEAADALGKQQTIFLWSQWYGVACRKVDDQGQETDEADTERFIAGMKAAGFGDLVSESINYNVLGAWIREQIPAKELAPVLPESVADILSTAQKYELRARKS